MGRIVTLRRQPPELGRLRLGHVAADVAGEQGKVVGRPARLECWRLTSRRRELLEAAAGVYGGTVRPWAGAPGGQPQFELYTQAAALRVVVPAGEPISQAYEWWEQGGCKRRCDGTRELRSGGPCRCRQEASDPRDWRCRPTTRLSVLLPDLPGVGVWRLETHGYYAAVELAGVAELLAATRGVVGAELRIEQRTVKRPGEPARQFAVPVLDVHATAGEVLGVAAAPAGTPGRRSAQELATPAPGGMPEAIAVALGADFSAPRDPTTGQPGRAALSAAARPQSGHGDAGCDAPAGGRGGGAGRSGSRGAGGVRPGIRELLRELRLSTRDAAALLRDRRPDLFAGLTARDVPRLAGERLQAAAATLRGHGEPAGGGGGEA
jgi:hypothetical protein